MSQKSKLKNPKSPDWARTSGSAQRKQARAYRKVAHIGDAPKHPKDKLLAKLATAPLTQVQRTRDRLFVKGQRLLKDFRKWRAEVPEHMPVEDWPDRPRLVLVGECYDAVHGLLRSRVKCALERPELVVPVSK